MKRALFVLAVSLLGCPPSNSGSEPDPHLGTLFVAFDEVSADPNLGSVSFINGTFDADREGTVHVIGTIKPSREFGRSNVHFNASQYWRVTRAGKVEEKAGPPYSAATVTNANLAVRIGLDDQQPVLVQTAGLAAGKMASFFSFDGTTWKEKAFQFTHRPEGVTATSLGPTDQLRALGRGQFVIQLQNRLLRSTDDGWTQVPLPPRATSIRLINGDAAALRVVWLDADGRLSTGTYARDAWTLNDGIRSTRLGATTTDFGTTFAASGSVEAFVLKLGMMTWRFGANAWTRTDEGARMEEGGFVPFSAGLMQVNCPVVDAGVPMVTENNPLGRDLTSPFPDSPEARRCLPRKVDVQMVPEPDRSGVILVTFDRAQDAVTRGYVKHVPYPVPADPFYGAPVEVIDAGIVELPPERQPRIVGSAFLVGAADQSDLSVSISRTGSNQRETSTPQPNGRFESLPLEPGDYTVVIAADDTVPSMTLSVTVGSEGAIDVGTHVLERPEGVPAAYRPGSQLLGFDGLFNSFQSIGATIERGNWQLTPSFTVLTTAAASTPAPVFEPELSTTDALLAWQEGAEARYAISGSLTSYTNVSMADFRLVGRRSPAVASGPVDGVTPRDWKWINDVPLVTGAVELGVASTATTCFGMAAWVPEDGGVSAKWRPSCATVATLQPLTGDVPTPPLTYLPTDTVITAFQGRACGKASGFVNPCPLFVISAGESTRVSDAAVDMRGTLFLERVGSTGTLKRYDFGNRTSVTLASNLSLPASYTNDARPFYVLQSGAALVRTASGFVFHQSGPVPVVMDVRRSWAVKNDVFVVACGASCSIEQLSSNNTSFTRTLLMKGASGGEEVGLVAGRYTVLSERAWPECPGGPCQVVSRTDDAAEGPRVLTRGSLVPIPKEAPFRPLLFLQLNPDGGAPLPSTLR